MSTSGRSVRGNPSGQAHPTETPMQAMVQETYGPADVLHLARISRPVFGPEDVLVRVHAAGLDRGTWHVTTGLPYALRLAYGMRAPKNPVPGLDLAGTVAAVGAAVTRFSIGDEVYGFGKGSFAEFAAASEKKLARKPANLTFVQASAVPVSASTALQALRAAGPIMQGQKVLILGASGGVGGYAVQLAKSAGAVVTGVSSTAKMDLVRFLGADHVIDYTRQDFAGGGDRYDLILDIAGNPTLSRLRNALTPSGTAVIVGGEEGGSWTGSMDRQLRALVLSPFISQRLTTVVGKENAADLEHLRVLIEAGTLRPVIDRTYTLEQTPEAMRYFEAGKARGKIVIIVRPHSA
ncbi:NAD(P)-dependent alcohol dehydrogenase [Arthrobacter sp. CAN_C5]|uniref:NAD(P)-dependent alcohol dehydrogenase n=1 Tax=Arthrobacter sp. CAN_C5 TaxID=2760706 RepID=UPI001FD8F0EF|nr:NAD(P)-dependent alcohol dehydrogenase [Arthrobacter sp. CAN_C5]MBP2216996.1 NADPH:quinone reductase-like Zn-dependent oxidoreductase [Arthrobacter sp. CAN_C5]